MNQDHKSSLTGGKRGGDEGRREERDRGEREGGREVKGGGEREPDTEIGQAHR